MPAQQCRPRSLAARLRGSGRKKMPDRDLESELHYVESRLHDAKTALVELESRLIPDPSVPDPTAPKRALERALKAVDGALRSSLFKQ